MQDVAGDEQTAIDEKLFMGFDHRKFMAQFPKGDFGWKNKNDPRVKKAFDGLKTSFQRKQYDVLLTCYAPLAPDYKTVDEKMEEMYRQYAKIIQHPTAPLLVVAGDIGIGKSYGWRMTAEKCNCDELPINEDPSDCNWGWVNCQYIKKNEELLCVLAKYNGTYTNTETGEEKPHVLVFDDGEYLLMARSKFTRATLTALTDEDEKKRIFYNPYTKQQELFKGVLVIITFWSVDRMSGCKTFKALRDRAVTVDLRLTRTETLQLIKQRYMTAPLGDFDNAFNRLFPTEKEQQEAREKVYRWIADHVYEADPMFFNTYLFRNAMITAAPKIANGGNTGIRYVRGVQVGSGLPWQQDLRNLLRY